jgi:glycosyltransferase involved in cell wall biosynthesis
MMGALNVVMVTPSATGGHPRYTWELMTALRSAAPPSELRLTLLTSRDLHEDFRSAPYSIADVLPALRPAKSFASKVHWATSRMAHYASRDEVALRWIRAQGSVDVVHYQEKPFAAPVHFARVAGAGCRPVATVHNLRPHRYHVPAARWVTDALAHSAWRRCSTLFVHSPGLRRQLAAELGPDSPPIIAIPHGVWTGHGSGTPESTRNGYLLLFGVMRRNKGVGLMLDAMRSLPGKRLVLAGAFEDSSFANEVRQAVAKDCLSVDVRDHAIPESEIARLFAGASLVVLPYTEFHSQSGVLHMAISYGIPVVVTDVGALGEQVRQQGIGVVAAALDAASIARAVLIALEPSAYSAAQRRCDEVARTLSWEAAAEITLNAYQRLRGEPRTA